MPGPTAMFVAAWNAYQAQLALIASLVAQSEVYKTQMNSRDTDISAANAIIEASSDVGAAFAAEQNLKRVIATANAAGGNFNEVGKRIEAERARLKDLKRSLDLAA